MSYEKQTWAKGDIVTSAKLNHMEDGIAGGGGVLVCNVTVDGNTGTLDHTWQEIYDAPIAIFNMPSAENAEPTRLLVLCTDAHKGNNAEYYAVTFRALEVPDMVIIFDATSADGYPSAQLG